MNQMALITATVHYTCTVHDWFLGCGPFEVVLPVAIIIAVITFCFCLVRDSK